MEKSEELQTSIGEEIDAESLIALGAEHGFEFNVEDLERALELSDDELDGVAGGFRGTPRSGELKSRPWFAVRRRSRDWNC